MTLKLINGLTEFQKLGCWYRHQYKPKTANATIIRDLITNFTKLGSVSPPRKKDVLSTYYDLYWDAKLKAESDIHWARVNKAPQEKAAEKNRFVRICYEAEPLNVKADIDASIEDDHAQDMDEWNQGKNIVPTAEGYAA
jgi:hypothetical protein